MQEKLTYRREHAIVDATILYSYNSILIRQVSQDSIDKSGWMPARSRRCREELYCKYVTVPRAGMGRRSTAMNPSQKNCLMDNHR